MKTASILFLIASASPLAFAATSATRPAPLGPYQYAKLRPVARQQTRLLDGFWKARVDASRSAGMRAVLDEYLTGKSAYITRNFQVASGDADGKRERGINSDEFLYKLMEAAAYYCDDADEHDIEAIRRDLDHITDIILAAQTDDGYLNTHVQCGGRRRFSTEGWMEFYFGGHLMQAGLADLRMTGRTRLFDAARKYIDLLMRETSPPEKWPYLTRPTDDWPYKFRHEDRRFVQRHPDIEMALVELHRATGEAAYLEFARLIMEGGENYLRREGLVDHAVKETLLNTGAIDYYIESGDRRFFDHVTAMWDDLNDGKMYITGGVGARYGGEAYGDNYELPNLRAYAETCAAISNVFWQWRMLLATGEGKYADLMERVLYNGFLAGVSLDGTEFFYANPLSRRDGAVMGDGRRHTYWGCSCCPPNIQRLFASLQTYIYTANRADVGVHLYTSSELSHQLPDGAQLTLTQSTEYPWDEDISIAVKLDRPARFTLSLRVPGWCQGASLSVDGKSVPVDPEGGCYVTIDRNWRGGEKVALRLPMEPRVIEGDIRVTDQVGRLALMRGPIVYCLESHDNPGADLDATLVPSDIELTAKRERDMLGDVVTLSGRAQGIDEDGSLDDIDITAIPYYAWANREPTEMDVWLACDHDALPKPKELTIAWRSAVSVSFWNKGQGALSLDAVKDQVDPPNSLARGQQWFHWWPHLSGVEWIQYDFAEAATVNAVDVYWFDDRGAGACRVPESWRLLYRKGDEWIEADNPSGYATERDRYNRVEFKAVKTSALRIEVQLKEGFSSGVVEWRVDGVDE